MRWYARRWKKLVRCSSCERSVSLVSFSCGHVSCVECVYVPDYFDFEDDESLPLSCPVCGLSFEKILPSSL
jgi:transcription elongation factor Elf1